MNKVLLVLLTLVIVACGKDFRNRYTFSKEQTCSVASGKIVCPDGSSMDLPTDGIDGRDGRDGLDGTDGLNGSIVNIVDPCGDDPDRPDEVVMVFSDGTILAWYQSLGLSVLQPGIVYRTTDFQKCNFMVVGGQVVEQ